MRTTLDLAEAMIEEERRLLGFKSTTDKVVAAKLIQTARRVRAGLLGAVRWT
jgi:hypothetical protein